jgi:RNA recognition motif 2
LPNYINTPNFLEKISIDRYIRMNSSLTLKNTFVHIDDLPMKPRLTRSRSLQDFSELTDECSNCGDRTLSFDAKLLKPIEPYTPTKSDTSTHASVERNRRHSHPSLISFPLSFNPKPVIPLRLGRRSSAPAHSVKQGVLGAAPAGYLPHALMPPFGGYKVPPKNGIPSTVMLRNISSRLSPSNILSLLKERGFSGCFDFFYLPVDFVTRSSLGYAFINFPSLEHLHRFAAVFHGVALPHFPTRNACEVFLAKVQGLEANVGLFAHSDSIGKLPDSFKPVVLIDKRYVPFPTLEGQPLMKW